MEKKIPSFIKMMEEMKGNHPLSITEKECLKVEIARCDWQIEYYQDLKRELEADLERLNNK